MVSQLSSRMLAGSGDSNSSTTGSSNTSCGQKRRLARRDNSLSGYSADREESSVSPPMCSIDLASGEPRSHSVREMNSCPKRQKRAEVQFAASCVRADMARGGLEFSTVNPEIRRTTTLGSVSINLKNVTLMNSRDFDKKASMAASRLVASTYDYQALALACWESYPHRSMHSIKLVSSSQDDSSQSTSSVSESDTDSVTSKCDPEASISIPPLLQEDTAETSNISIPEELGSCSVIPSMNRTMTMGDSLALTTTPRLVAMSCHPFSIVHANAAFMRMSGLPYEKIVGSGFGSIVDNDKEGKPVLLSDCLVSSGSCDHCKLQLVREDEAKPLVEKWARVMPIVNTRSIQPSELSNVTHFAVDLVEESDLTSVVMDNLSSIKPVDGGDLAVEVMG